MNSLNAQTKEIDTKIEDITRGRGAHCFLQSTSLTQISKNIANF